MWIGYRSVRADLHKGDIVFAEGVLRWETKKVVDYMSKNQTYKLATTLMIGEVQFPKYTNRNHLSKVFIEGEIYRVYYLPTSKTIISAELVNPDQMEKEQKIQTFPVHLPRV